MYAIKQETSSFQYKNWTSWPGISPQTFVWLILVGGPWILGGFWTLSSLSTRLLPPEMRAFSLFICIFSECFTRHNNLCSIISAKYYICAQKIARRMFHPLPNCWGIVFQRNAFQLSRTAFWAVPHKFRSCPTYLTIAFKFVPWLQWRTHMKDSCKWPQ